MTVLLQAVKLGTLFISGLCSCLILNFFCWLNHCSLFHLIMIQHEAYVNSNFSMFYIIFIFLIIIFNNCIGLLFLKIAHKHDFLMYHHAVLSSTPPEHTSNIRVRMKQLNILLRLVIFSMSRTHYFEELVVYGLLSKFLMV